MPVLIYETGPRKGQTIRLEEGGVYVLGRDPRAQVPIDDELASRQHAKLRGKDGRYFVKDATSSNGTLVNDARVDLAELSSGDKVTVGTTILTFLSDQEAGGDGRTLGGYKLLQRLGRGGMGTVFRALQLSLNREVALKILSPELSRDPSFPDRFLKEARAAGQLNHPNIVQVYDVDREGGLVFYAMEFVPGGTVEDRLNKEGALPVDEALRLLLDAAKGLQYAERSEEHT
ncbi:MAG: FHA domain-containing protein, partial [Planctomycetota bacterium JB042]